MLLNLYNYFSLKKQLLDVKDHLKTFRNKIKVFINFGFYWIWYDKCLQMVVFKESSGVIYLIYSL